MNFNEIEKLATEWKNETDEYYSQSGRIDADRFKERLVKYKLQIRAHGEDVKRLDIKATLINGVRKIGRNYFPLNYKVGVQGEIIYRFIDTLMIGKARTLIEQINCEHFGEIEQDLSGFGISSAGIDHLVYYFAAGIQERADRLISLGYKLDDKIELDYQSASCDGILLNGELNSIKKNPETGKYQALLPMLPMGAGNIYNVTLDSPLLLSYSSKK